MKKIKNLRLLNKLTLAWISLRLLHYVCKVLLQNSQNTLTCISLISQNIIFISISESQYLSPNITNVCEHCVVGMWTTGGSVVRMPSSTCSSRDICSSMFSWSPFCLQPSLYQSTLPATIVRIVVLLILFLLGTYVKYK